MNDILKVIWFSEKRENVIVVLCWEGQIVYYIYILNEQTVERTDPNAFSEIKIFYLQFHIMRVGETSRRRRKDYFVYKVTFPKNNKHIVVLSCKGFSTTILWIFLQSVNDIPIQFIFCFSPSVLLQACNESEYLFEYWWYEVPETRAIQ